MNILVIGSGGREHALVWKLRQSPMVKTVYCAPGNAGIEHLALRVPLKPTDIKGLMKFVKEEKIDLTVVGSEQPLVEGIVDAFEEHGFKIFGPSKAAAQLEGSKVFSKNFMLRHRIPTAGYRTFAATEIGEAKKYIATMEAPIVVKADGLAAGKGVIICKSRQEASLALDHIVLDKSYGPAGNQIVVEEFLNGEEASLFVLTDGERFAMLASAQDHKRILDGDLGKNTGGMGAYAPAPIVTRDLLQTVIHDVVYPTLDGMRQEGMPYRGCLYIGLMMTPDGPRVLEYNCRFGDPETQVVVPLIDGDLAEIFLAIAERRLDPSKVKLHSAAAVCVVMASHGYPDEYQTGRQIFGLENIKAEDGVVVFHAGTKKEGNAIVTSGGRVLGVTAIGFNNELEQTIQNAYHAVEKITFDGAYYRSDIGKKALKHLHSTQLSEQGDTLNILITGGAGFIGSHIADAYIAEGHHVIIVDNLSGGVLENMSSEAKFYQLDIRSEKLEDVFQKEKIDVVNHLAAQMDVRRSVADPKFDASVNVVGGLNVFESAKKHRVKKIIFSSTGGAIYGEQDYFPADEVHPTRPLSPYGITKLCTEKYLFFYKAVYGINHVILRYANVYGPRQNPHGEAGVVAIFCNKMLKGEQPVINGDGTQTRDYTFVGDVVKANVLALHYDGSNVYNIGTGTEADVNKLFRELRIHLHPSCPEQHAPAKAGEQQRSVISFKKIESELGWKPSVQLEEGLRLTAEYFKQKISVKKL